MVDGISCIYICAITVNNQLHPIGDLWSVVMKSHQVRVSKPWLPYNLLEWRGRPTPTIALTTRLCSFRREAAGHVGPETVCFVTLIVLKLSLLPAQIGLTCSSLFSSPGLVTLSVRWPSQRATGDTLGLGVLLLSQLMQRLNYFSLKANKQNPTKLKMREN